MHSETKPDPPHAGGPLLAECAPELATRRPGPTPVAAEFDARRSWKRDLLRLVLVTCFFVCAGWAMARPAWREFLFDIEVERAWVQSHGAKGHLIFTLGAALLVGLGLPRLWVSAAAGSLYGSLLGTPIALFATLLGATLTWLLGHSFLRGPTQRHLPARLRPMLARFQEHDFRWIVYLRLLPFTNATLTNLLCGAAGIPLRVFVLATLVGYLPYTLVFAILGNSAATSNPWQLGLGLGIFAVVLLGRMLLRKRQAETRRPEHRARD